MAVRPGNRASRHKAVFNRATSASPGRAMQPLLPLHDGWAGRDFAGFSVMPQFSALFKWGQLQQELICKKLHHRLLVIIEAGQFNVYNFNVY